MENTQSTPTLGSVVQGIPKISVDDYQRTYQWEKPQLDEFFNDLLETTDHGDNHFFGTLILQNSETGASLVDGQQRLTTVFILVSALRDFLDELGIYEIEAKTPNELPVNVRAELWKFLFNNDNSSQHRFESNRFLRKLMAENVIAAPLGRPKLPTRDRQVTLNFRKAVGILNERLQKDLLKQSTNDEKLARIYKLFKCIRDRFIILRVDTKTTDESLEIFLTLNNRGLPLGPSDLVRGEIIRARSFGLSAREQSSLNDEIFKDWEDLTDAVKEPDVFLRHYLVATGTEPIQKKKVVSAVLSRFSDTNPETKKQKARDFWEDLLEAADVYGAITNPQTTGDVDYRLMQLEGLTKSHRILLLTVFRQVTDPLQISEICRATVALSYRWVIAGMNAQDLEKFFQKQSTQLRDGGSGDDVLVALKSEATVPNGDLTKFLTNEGDTSFVTRALLHAIDRNLRHGAIPIPLNGELHLEHIAPKAGNEEWKRELFNSDPSKYEQYETVISEAGNLTLLDQKINIKAQNKSFSAKKIDHYQSATLSAITRDLCDLENWTSEIVRQRTIWLVEMFERLWAINNSNNNAIRFTDWLEGNSPN